MKRSLRLEARLKGRSILRVKEPAKGEGIRKTLRRAGLMVYLVYEYCSSCKCNDCHCYTEKFFYLEPKKPKMLGQLWLVHGLSFQNASRCGTLWNRDVNACSNMRIPALGGLTAEERPMAFRGTFHTQSTLGTTQIFLVF